MMDGDNSPGEDAQAGHIPAQSHNEDGIGTRIRRGRRTTSNSSTRLSAQSSQGGANDNDPSSSSSEDEDYVPAGSVHRRTRRPSPRRHIARRTLPTSITNPPPNRRKKAIPKKIAQNVVSGNDKDKIPKPEPPKPLLNEIIQIKNFYYEEYREYGRSLAEMQPKYMITINLDENPNDDNVKNGYYLGEINLKAPNFHEKYPSFTNQNVHEVFTNLKWVNIRFGSCRVWNGTHYVGSSWQSNKVMEYIFEFVTENQLTEEEGKTAESRYVFYKKPNRKYMFNNTQSNCTNLSVEGIPADVFKGLCTKSVFRVTFLNYDDATSMVKLNVVMLGSAVLESHSLGEIQGDQSRPYVVDVWNYFCNLPRKENRLNFLKLEDNDWFYGQMKKYHDQNEAPELPVNIQHPSLIPSLRPYQKKAVNWMLYVEGMIPEYSRSQDYFKEMLHKEIFKPITLQSNCAERTPVQVFYNPYTYYICHDLPHVPVISGGVLADEMGLGKTVEVLALILANPRPGTDDERLEESKMLVNDVKRLSYGKRKRASSPCEFEANTSKDSSPRKSKPTTFDTPVTEASVAKTPRLKRKATMDAPDPGTSLYSKMKPIYDATLGSLATADKAKVIPKFHGSFFDTNVARKAFFECVCGKGSENENLVVTCSNCGSSQHAECVGIDCDTDYALLLTYRCPHCTVAEDPIPVKTTLIVTPTTIAYQWISEIQRHIKDKQMKILFYKGVSEHGFIPPAKLGTYDLIITTYKVFSKEIIFVDLPHCNSESGRRLRNPKRFLTVPSPLLSIVWWRVCLDEAQMVEGIKAKMAQMATMLRSTHRWAVSGTPMDKGLEDLHGLVTFLKMAPINDFFWWNTLIQDRYYRRETEFIVEFFGNIFWRTGKNDVLDQLGLPLQSDIPHSLTFSAVETHFYKRHHQLCTGRIMEKITRLCEQFGDSIIFENLSGLHHGVLSGLLQPFLELRQACCHPQLIKGQSLALNKLKGSLTMEELLDQLIAKTTVQCAENHRLVVAALNGSAGVHMLLNQHLEASDLYREVLQLAVKHETVFKTDTLQMIHTLVNLADILDMNIRNIPFTLRDDTLRRDADVLKAKYLENHANNRQKAKIASENSTKEVEDIRVKFNCKTQSWWVSVLHRAARVEKSEELVSRIKEDLIAYASKRKQGGSLANKFNDIYGLQHSLTGILTDLESKRAEMLDAISTLQEFGSENLVHSAVVCHLRKEGTEGKPASGFDYRCILCQQFDHFLAYETILYTEEMADKRNKVNRLGRKWQRAKQLVECGNGDIVLDEDDETALLLKEEQDLIESTDHVQFMQTQGFSSWRDSDAEKALKLLLTFGRTNGCGEKVLEDGNNHMKLYDALKKEFKVVRVFFNKINDEVSALDELNQATMRMQLKTENDDDDEPGPSSSHATRTKKTLGTGKNEQAKKICNINKIWEFELVPKLGQLKNEVFSAKSEFSVHLGQLLYLETLKKNGYGKKGAVNTDECPICTQQLGQDWCVLLCGHSYCSDCTKKMCNSNPAQSFLCPLCRQSCGYNSVSFVDTTVDDEDEATTSTENANKVVVKGSHSTKVEGIVATLLKLQISNPGDKVLIFSTWTNILTIIANALDANDIPYVSTSAPGSKQFQKSLDRFKTREDIQVLLMPLNSGSKGLNIIEATRVFLVEPVLNLASEKQAVGRVHRIGQTKPTFVHRFYVKKTIEEQLYEVLKTHEVSNSEEGMLTVADLKKVIGQ